MRLYRGNQIIIILCRKQVSFIWKLVFHVFENPIYAYLLILAALWCTARNTLIFTRGGALPKKKTATRQKKFFKSIERYMDGWIVVIIGCPWWLVRRKAFPKDYATVFCNSVSILSVCCGNRSIRIADTYLSNFCQYRRCKNIHTSLLRAFLSLESFALEITSQYRLCRFTFILSSWSRRGNKIYIVRHEEREWGNEERSQTRVTKSGTQGNI